MMVIPCPLSTMQGNISLLRNDLPVNPSEYMFLPYKGMVLQTPAQWEDNYTCVFEDESWLPKTYAKRFYEESEGWPTMPTSAKLKVKPAVTSIFLHDDESVTLYCGLSGVETQLGHLSMEVYFQTGASRRQINSTDTIEYDVNRLQLQITLTRKPRGVSAIVYVGCIKNSNVTLWEWKLSYKESPSLLFNNDRVYCFQAFGVVWDSMTAISCHSFAQCALVDGWLRDDAGPAGGVMDGAVKLSNNQSQGGCPTDSCRDYIAMELKMMKPGLVSCCQADQCGGRWCRSFSLFTTLSGYWASSWIGIPDSELVALPHISDKYRASLTYKFICKAVAFHFVKGAIMWKTYRNGTNESASVYPTWSTDGKTHEYRIFVTVSTDLANVGCRVMWWNSTNTLSTELPLSVTVQLPPIILRQNEGSIQDNFTLQAGSLGSLNCTTSVDDHREIHNFTWAKGQEKVIPNKEQSSGTSILQLRNVNKNDQGMYRCLAVNSFGSDVHYFSVSVNGIWPNGTKGDEDGGSHTVLISSLLFVTLLITAAGFGLLGVKYYRTKKSLGGLTSGEQNDFFAGDEPYDVNFEITDNTITQGEQIGSGEFGVVFKATCATFPGQQLAIKTTKPWSDKEKLKAMLQEVKLMIRVGEHPNVVKFFGACTTKISEGKLLVLLGYCPGGDLLTHIRRTVNPNYEQHKHAILEELCGWAKNIACGMEFIHTKNIIHGDLAARNVLLDQHLVARISDFGLAKQLYNDVAYRRRHLVPLPWRWMAPESLSTLEMSSASDVWSYGITLWELFTLGKVPYASGMWNTQHETNLAEGYRLPKPQLATTQIFDKMTMCWSYDPNDRPGFDDLTAYLSMQYAEFMYTIPIRLRERN